MIQTKQTDGFSPLRLEEQSLLMGLKINERTEREPPCLDLRTGFLLLINIHCFSIKKIQ